MFRGEGGGVMCGVSLRCLGRVASFTRHSIARTPARRILPAFLLGLSRVPRQMPSPAEQELWGRLASRRPYGRSVSASTTKHGQHGAGVLRRVPRVPLDPYRTNLRAMGVVASGFSLIQFFTREQLSSPDAESSPKHNLSHPRQRSTPSSRGFAPTPGDCFTDGQSRMFTAPR